MTLLDWRTVWFEPFSKIGLKLYFRVNFNFEFFPQKNEMQEIKLNYLLDILSATDKSPIGNIVLKNIYILNVVDLKTEDKNARREQIMAFLCDSIKTSLVNDLNNIFVRGKLPPVHISTIFPENMSQKKWLKCFKFISNWLNMDF